MDEAEILLVTVRERVRHLALDVEVLVSDTKELRELSGANRALLAHLCENDHAGLRRIIREEIVSATERRGVTLRETLAIILSLVSVLLAALAYLHP